MCAWPAGDCWRPAYDENIVEKEWVCFWLFLWRCFLLSPFFLFVSSAFKTQTQITAIPPRWLPHFPDFFHSAIVRYDILGYLLNSIIVAGSTTVVTIFLATLAGYALARLPGRWAQMILMLILACAMFPQIAIVGPIWRFLWFGMAQYLSGIGSTLCGPYPASGGLDLGPFFREMPGELEAAALVDGCSRMGALMRVIVPLSAPGLFTAAILTFIYAWNEFFLALLIVTDPAKQTMPVGIALFQGEHTIPGEKLRRPPLSQQPLGYYGFAFPAPYCNRSFCRGDQRIRKMASLRLKGISKRFGDVVAFSQVDLYVEEGEFCVLLGPSGCGKSTLLQIVAGLTPQDEGSVLVDGQPVDQLTPRDRDVAMVFQSYALYPHMTVAQNLGFRPSNARHDQEHDRKKGVRDGTSSWD